MVSLNIYKNSAKKFGRKTGFKIENEIEDQDQSIPKLIGILTQVFCTFGLNLVVLAWTGDELSCRQAQNGVTFDFEVKFDLEGQGQSPPKTIVILTKVFYTYGPNLVILAWTDDELSRRQAEGWHTLTGTHTDRRRQRASGKNANYTIGINKLEFFLISKFNNFSSRAIKIFMLVILFNIIYIHQGSLTWINSNPRMKK